MNIKDAKNEIIHTLAAYLKKDGNGAYTYPLWAWWLTPSRIILVRVQWDFPKLSPGITVVRKLI